MSVACSNSGDIVTNDNPTFIYRDTHRMLPFPSDRFLARDTGPRPDTDERASGFHIQLSPYDRLDPALANTPETVESLAGLDGFGTSAEIALGFTFAPDMSDCTQPVDNYAHSIADDAPIVLQSIDPEDPDAGIPLAWACHFEHDGNVLFMRPALPLKPSSWYAVVVRPTLRDIRGRSYKSPPGYLAHYHAAATNPESEGFMRLRELGLDAPLYAFTFRTASISTKLDELLADVRQLTPSPVTWTLSEPTLEQAAVALMLEGSFIHRDYRDARGKLTRMVMREERIPFSLTLPKPTADFQEPFSVVLAQHGFSSHRQDMLRLADTFAKQGLALLTLDAPNHGSRGPGNGVAEDFITGLQNTFGIGADGGAVHIKGWYFRDLLRQQVLTHLQLIRAITEWQGDIARLANAPGTDLDLSKLGYIGHSMGAVIGGVSGSVTPEFGRVVLNAGGGRITDVFARNAVVNEQAILALRPRGVSLADGWRVVNFLQATIDPGDPINYVGRMTDAPSVDLQPRSLLLQNARNDFLVANHASFALARAAGASQIGPHYTSTYGVPRASAPGHGESGDNLALMAFHREVYFGNTRVPADHGNILFSDTGMQQAAFFLAHGVVMNP